MLFRSNFPRHRSRRRTTHQLETLEARELLTTLTVTTLADTIANDGEMSLREAMNQAIPGDEVVFNSGLNGTVELSLGPLQVAPNLTLTGNGAANTNIDAQGNSDVFLEVRNSLTLRSLTISNSETNGISFRGAEDQFRIIDAVITGSGDAGVVVSNNIYEYSSQLTITDSVITNNGARGLAVTGQIRGTVSDSDISGNVGGVSLTGFYGGPRPSVTISNSVVGNNIAPNTPGGGIAVELSALTVRDSIVTGNEGSTGGGIFADQTALLISSSTIVGNSGTDGGGLYLSNFRAAKRLENLTIVDNTATRDGGCLLYTSPSPRD